MIFTIKTDDEVAGLDITKALLQAGIKHTILSKQNDEAAEQSFAPDASPDTVASVCEHGHIVACPHGCR